MDVLTLRRLRAGLLAALLLVGACGGGGGDESIDTEGDDGIEADAGDTDADGDVDDTGADDADADGTADDKTAEGAAAATDDGGTDPAAPPAGSGGAPPASAAAPAPAPTPAPAPGGQAAQVAAPVVPKGGTYTYERTTTNDEGTETTTSDSVVTRLSGDDRAAELRLEQDSAQGRLVSDASAGPEGILVRSSVIESQVGEINCDWTPDWLFVGAWTVGQTWTVDTSCKDDVNGLKVDVTLKGGGTVVGVESITVRGRTLDAWVVDTTMATTADVQSPALSGSTTGEAKDRSWIDPATGMTVRSESQESMSGDFGNGTSTTVTELVSYRP